jgi:RNA polymerase sigma-70 factor (ECF subfamily)
VPTPNEPDRAGAQASTGSDADRLFALVYDRLHSLARRHMAAERAGHTLQPTALVHEAYLKLADQREARIANRTQFLAIASQAMRRILVDHARARSAEKRGGGLTLVTLRTDIPGEERELDVLRLDEALDRLAELDPRQARLVELRFFGGLEIEEAAEALGTSRTTAIRDWRLARAWLAHELRDDPRGDENPR